MNDLISRSALLEKATNVTKYDEGGWGMDLKAVPIEDVLKAPAVDAVEVCRCKDCAWCKKPFPEHFPQMLECMRYDMEVAADEFCSRSERRDD